MQGRMTWQDASKFLVLGSEGKTVAGPVVEKLRAAWVIKHHRGSLGYVRDRLFDSAPQRCVMRSICEALRSEFVTFLSCGVVCGRKAPKSICQQANCALDGFCH